MHQFTRSTTLCHQDLLRHNPQQLFSSWFDPAWVNDALTQENVHWLDRGVFTPCLTLWLFVSQILDPDHSCRATIARLVAKLAALGENPPSSATGAYCKARKRLPVEVLARLARRLGTTLQDHADPSWRFRGRNVWLVDGTTVTMPDTAENQRQFPQNPSQKPGLGFPIARLVGLISLATGAVVDLAVGPYLGKETGESALLRALLARLKSGDILLGDRSFGSFLGITPLLDLGVDGLFRMHQRRKVEPRGGRCQTISDHLRTWPKPKRPAWMDRATYDQLPAQLTIRELQMELSRPGFRVTKLILVTTLLDAKAYPADEVMNLYKKRWNIELDFRSIKCVMGMDVLRCKTPAMVEKEIWAYLLGYNIVRANMVEAAEEAKTTPRALSYQGTRQTLLAFDDALRRTTGEQNESLKKTKLAAIARHRVGQRPDRLEPRAKKRRPNQHPLLTLPREEARKLLLHGT